MRKLDILNNELLPTLTDFVHNQHVFRKAFEQANQVGMPIKNVLELGVYRLKGEPSSPFPGQSTKTLMILTDVFPVDRFISLDIDDCRATIEFCKDWVRQRGINVTNHEFIQSNSIEFKAEVKFPAGIDFIFLDTNHDDTYPERIGYPGSGGPGMTYREICYYAKHLTKNGHFFLHDTKNHYAEVKYGLNTDGAIAKFLDENPQFAFFEHDTNVNGLGELYHKDSDIAKRIGISA